MSRIQFCGLFLVLFAVAPIGCNSVPDPDAMIRDANKTNLHRLCNLYNYFQAKNAWKGPKDEVEFKKFIQDQTERILQRMGVAPADLEKLFVSERDGEAFVIRYGVAGSSRGSDEPVVFEKTGVEGKRMVGFTSTQHREVDSSEYESLLSKK